MRFPVLITDLLDNGGPYFALNLGVIFLKSRSEAGEKTRRRDFLKDIEGERCRLGKDD